jgi:hypothetical protein
VQQPHLYYALAALLSSRKTALVINAFNEIPDNLAATAAR